MKEYIGEVAKQPRDYPYGTIYVYVIGGSLPGAQDYFRGDMLAMWEEDGVTELIFEEPFEASVKNYINTRHPSAQFMWEGKIDYSDWEANRPVVATHAAGFLICPSWDVREPESCEERIIIDPGLSFGTGLHPTTWNCLGLLRRVYEEDRPARVLDFGCGSGILSAAAIKLGAQSSVAIDYSLIAYNAAEFTARLNGIEDRMSVLKENVMNHLHHEADLILCNINFPVIVDLLNWPEFERRKWIIFSGINPERQHDEMMKALEASSRRIVEIRRSAIWFSYLTKKE